MQAQIAELVFGCVLAAFNSDLKEDPRCIEFPLVAEIAYSVGRASSDLGLPPEIVAAVAYHESKFNVRAVGSRGEIGIFQLLRGGALQGRQAKKARRELENVYLNTWVATSYLARMRDKCGGNPHKWLSAYNGRGCRRSKYSDAVLGGLHRVTKTFSRLD